MSERLVRHCDRCGTSANVLPRGHGQAGQAFLPTGDTDDVVLAIDLCGVCCHAALVDVLDRATAGQVRTWFMAWKTDPLTHRKE